ncbi:MAG: amidohydrolase [Desulfobulbaceae bacterium]|nr:MAG: amidohydrolase [Desulfobulbaceae bacterium]
MNPHLQTQLIVSGSYLLPTCHQQNCIKNGAVAIANDTIVDIGERSHLLKRYPEVREIHEPHGLVMPGLVNTHTHAAMSCFRGFADDLPLMTWLQEYIFPVEAQLDSSMVYYSTLLSIAEMIKSGTTSFCDMYLFAKDVARAAEQAGIRSWIGEVLYDFQSPSYGKLEDGFIYVREMLELYRDHPLITITVDPHSVYTCAPSLLKKCGLLAEEFDTLLVTHLAETETEVDLCRTEHGATPVSHLENLGLLDNNLLAAHCVKLNENDIELLAARDVKVSHCQESNMKLASGTAPIPALLQRGVTVSIGTDGSASNNDVDMFSEMNTVAKVHKVSTMDPTIMNAETTLHAATLGGASALGVDDQIGSLEPGKKEDLIVLDLNQPHLTPLYNIPSHLVYAARGADVVHSIINGTVVMQNRKLLTLDESALIVRMSDIAQKVLNIRKRAIKSG